MWKTPALDTQQISSSAIRTCSHWISKFGIAFLIFLLLIFLVLITILKLEVDLQLSLRHQITTPECKPCYLSTESTPSATPTDRSTSSKLSPTPEQSPSVKSRPTEGSTNAILTP